MFKQLIVVSSLLVGAGSAGTAMYLQANPLALSKGERVNLQTYLYSAKTDARSSEPERKPAAIVRDAAPMIVDLPEVVVGPYRPAKAVTSPQAPVTTPPSDVVAPSTTPRELHPCSKFREISPVNVDDGVPTGVRGVRDLC